MQKERNNLTRFARFAAALPMTIVLGGCDWFCEECALPTICGDETAPSELVDGGGNVVGYECNPTADWVRCGDGTYEKDGGGGTVDRDDIICEAINTSPTFCGTGTVEQDGGGGTVERDTIDGPQQFPVESCVPGVIDP